MSKFNTVEQVEDHFNIAFTANQYVDILNYIKNGVIPEPDGCTTCERAFVREWIGRIMAVENAS